MRSIFFCKFIFLLFIACSNNSKHFENERFVFEDLNGYQLDSIQEGSMPIVINGKKIYTSDVNQPEYVIFKRETSNTNNYLRIGSLNLQGLSEDEYLNALLDQLQENYPPFTIERNVHDTIVNLYKGHVFKISIDLGNKEMEQSIFVLKSKTDKIYQLILTIIDDNQAVKKDFENIISKMVLK